MTQLWVTGAVVGVPGYRRTRPDRARLEEMLPVRRTRFLDRGTILAIAAIEHLGTRDRSVEALIASAAAGNRCPRTGIVVASYVANADSVADLAIEIRRNPPGGLLSPMLLPRVSSNVIASEVAIWLRLTGPNYTICNDVGTAAGALRVARLLLDSNQADDILVVAVEPQTDWSAKLWGNDSIHDEVAVLRLSRNDEGALALLKATERSSGLRSHSDMNCGVGSRELARVSDTLEDALRTGRICHTYLAAENPCVTLDVTITPRKSGFNLNSTNRRRLSC